MSTPRLRMMLLTALALFALLASACGDDDVATGRPSPGGEDPDGGESFEGSWQLVSGSVDGDTIPLVDGRRITMTISDDELGGVAACNSYGGLLTIDDGSFGLGEVSWTSMGCEPDVSASEQAYLAALLRVTAIAHDGETIVLTGGEAELRFVELPPAPTADLVDTVWELDTIIDGETASSVTGDAATLELRSDGTLVGSTGCRTLTGTWVESGDTIVTPELSASGECPAELAPQDGQVVEVLEGPFQASIDGQRLTLTAPGNVGLSLRATTG